MVAIAWLGDLIVIHHACRQAGRPRELRDAFSSFRSACSKAARADGGDVSNKATFKRAQQQYRIIARQCNHDAARKSKEHYIQCLSRDPGAADRILGSVVQTPADGSADFMLSESGERLSEDTVVEGALDYIKNVIRRQVEVTADIHTNKNYSQRLFANKFGLSWNVIFAKAEFG